MAFPFLFLSVSLAWGIFLSRFLSISPGAWAVILLVILSFAWILFLLRRTKLSFFFVLLSTFLLGASLYSVHHKNFEANSLHNLHYKDYADFYGTLYKSPSKGKDKDYLFLKAKKVIFQNKAKRIDGNLRITVYHSPESASLYGLLVGDKIKVSARLLSYRGFRNFHDFSMDLYFKSQKIHNRAFTKSPMLVEKIKSGGKFSPLRFISFIRQGLQRKIEHHFPSSDPTSLSSPGAVFEALLLGERRRMDDSLTRSLQSAGIYHLFAISGAHIAIISFLFFSIFKLFRVPHRLSYILIMIFLIFYAFLVEGRPSVVRATLMTLAFLLGKIIWCNVNLINTISISAFFLLLFNPFSLFHVGFQLTFAATLSIILFFPRLIKYFPRLPLRISEIFVLSLTAQLGVLPIMASVFHRVTFSSLLLNYIALPLVGAIMGCGYLFFLLSCISSFLSQLLAKVISLLINFLASASHFLDWIPSISYRLPSPHLVTIMAYYVFLLLLLVPPKIRRQTLALVLCFLLSLAVLITYPFPPVSKNLRLTLIDVGQGESILVEFPGRKKMLIDGGGYQTETFDIGENVVSPFLWEKGIKTIHHLVLTHAHPDHLNGLKAVARNFRIKEFWEALSPADNQSYAEFRSLIPSSTVCHRVFRGESLVENPVKVDVLHPERKYPLVPAVHNNQSLVLSLSYGKTSFLLTGDIGKHAEAEILKTAEKIRSQVLKSPHHGSNSSSSMDFLRKVHPQVVIISVGEGNRYGFPDPEVLNRYKKIGAKIYRTDLHGAIEISSDGKKISIRTAVSNLPSD
ncbi:MAG: DNA internalization-related competence protein ComEC/Rec2 [Candidatus Aminicenantes bacterium]